MIGCRAFLRLDWTLNACQDKKKHESTLTCCRCWRDLAELHLSMPIVSQFVEREPLILLVSRVLCCFSARATTPTDHTQDIHRELSTCILEHMTKIASGPFPGHSSRTYLLPLISLPTLDQGHPALHNHNSFLYLSPTRQYPIAEPHPRAAVL